MPPNELRLPAELEARVVAAARAAGKSPQDVVVDAIEAYFATGTEDRASFVAEAFAARQEFERTGLAYDADEVFDYLLARAQGNTSSRPTLKQWSD